MTVRPATYADIAGIVSLLHEGHRRSHYARTDVMLDEREAKRLLVQSIQRHGSVNLGGTFLMVAEKADGRISGVILGTMSRLYGILDRMMASDIFWLASLDVDPGDPVALMRSMVEWAKSAPDCFEVKCGTSAIIRDDPKEAGRALERLGMTHYGEIYRMEIER
ncbi:hypothetical protein DYI37_03910 [Fulvimarina endophytica]|uniref:N-acetyltransferase domain-containing protein n=1 Tax=Fulvimarina endophytica TaxID=2293836 RepID=A0A371X758_9HYPH|nr:hypothetical protein [Fulvimarina endophytica]RFC65021.1 hypothetical protein DYI37_03910 [Fulvimarina endophytica]